MYAPNNQCMHQPMKDTLLIPMRLPQDYTEIWVRAAFHALLDKKIKDPRMLTTSLFRKLILLSNRELAQVHHNLYILQEYCTTPKSPLLGGHVGLSHQSILKTFPFSLLDS